MQIEPSNKNFAQISETENLQNTPQTACNVPRYDKARHQENLERACTGKYKMVELRGTESQINPCLI